jgi:hypothetical protein
MSLLIPCSDLRLQTLLLLQNVQLRRKEVRFSRSKSRKFPVFFPVSREFGGERLARDCALRQPVLTAEKFCWSLSRNPRNMPVFRDISPKNRTAEKELLIQKWGTFMTFLRSAHAQSGFQTGFRRMQCDHRLNAKRTGLDLPRGFLESHSADNRTTSFFNTDLGETSFVAGSELVSSILRAFL